MATATEPLALNDGLDENMKFKVSRVIRAERTRVYEAWTDPKIILAWFGPPNRVTSDVRVDLRVGGQYYFEMTGEGLTPRVASASGIYKEIVPNELLRFTWQATWAGQEDTLITISLKDAPGGTEVTLLHEHFRSIDSMTNHEKGWVGALEKFASVLEAQA